MIQFRVNDYRCMLNQRTGHITIRDRYNVETNAHVYMRLKQRDRYNGIEEVVLEARKLYKEIRNEA